jgi:hypothetical protein
MNTARNDITGRVIKTDPPTSNYRDGWDRIFNKNKQVSKKLVLASATWCGPCQGLKKRLESENILDRVELKDADVDIAFFKDNNVKSVPRLFIIEDDKVTEFIQGVEEIYNRIKETSEL